MKNRKGRLYAAKEFLLWKLAVFRLLLLMGIAWLLYKAKPSNENRMLYLSVKHSYERVRTL